MPEKETVERAKQDLRTGKSPSTAAGEFVREEIHHVREGKHGARSPQQAVAIGLSKARRAGVPLEPPQGTRTPKRDHETGQGKRKRQAPSGRRSRATRSALERESRSSASPSALASQGRRAAAQRKRQGLTQDAHRGRPRAAGKTARRSTSRP
jgi:hypothetical protein